jgi:S1-C subfamily serine protease
MRKELWKGFALLKYFSNLLQNQTPEPDRNMKAYYIYQNNQELGPFSMDALKSRGISRDTLVWAEGMTTWQQAGSLSEMRGILGGAAADYGKGGGSRKNRNAKSLLVGGAVLIALVIAGIAGYKTLFGSSSKKILTPEQINQKYAPSVVLIKHAFIYKIHIAEHDYYFTKFNEKTGEIMDLTFNAEEARKHPNIIYGTGFFIDKNGSMLTNRHVVNVMPSAEEKNTILNWLRSSSMEQYFKYKELKETATAEYERLENLLGNYSEEMGMYDYERYSKDKEARQQQAEEYSLYLALYEYFMQAANEPGNFVSKNSFQFGVFLNNTKNKDLNAYIKCQSTQISEDDNIDLAIIRPKEAIADSLIKPVDLDRVIQFKEEQHAPRLNEKLYMIGFNFGAEMAATSQGFISQFTSGNISQAADEYRVLYTIPALPGSSGAPVLDERGQLVCVNFAGIRNSQSFNYGVNTKKIKQFLNK